MPHAIITGSSRGIGRACAGLLLESGWAVTLNSRSEYELAQTERELRAVSPYVRACQSDVGSEEGAAKLYRFAVSSFGEPDALVNNAGIAEFGLFTDSTEADWLNIHQVNLFSAMHMSKLGIPAMVRRRRGSIVNISSVWGCAGASCEAVYSASKGALNAFTRSLAKELAPSGLTVNAIACGAIDTQMNARMSQDEVNELCAKIPLGRMGRPGEVAETVLFLINQSYITGQIIGVDGGLLVCDR